MTLILWWYLVTADFEYDLQMVVLTHSCGKTIKWDNLNGMFLEFNFFFRAGMHFQLF